jgi:hypothetical protein
MLHQGSKDGESVEHFEAAMKHFATLLRESPDTQSKVDHAYPMLGLAVAKLALNERGEAVAMWRESAPVLRELIGSEKSSTRQSAMVNELVRQHVSLAYDLDEPAAAAEMIGLLMAEMSKLSDSAAVESIFAWRAELAEAHAPAQLAGILTEWGEKYPSSAVWLAWRGRAEAMAGHVERAAELFTRARAGGWKPEPAWLSEPRLSGALSGP